MKYDVALIRELASELGFRVTVRGDDEITLDVDPSAKLVFQNDAHADDGLMGFEDTPWHIHGHLLCSANGRWIEVPYLDVVSGLADRTILLCEFWERGALRDRSLVHRDFVDEFRDLRDGDEIRIRPASPVR